MTFGGVPGYVETKEAYGETTVIVERPRVADAARYMRDELGFGFLSDIAAADYLGWGERGVAGYWGHERGRDINAPFPSSQGLPKLPEPKPKRFSVSYQLLALDTPPRRVRLQTWCDEGEAVPTVIEVWPAADWFEREAWDMMGIPFDGHPNLARLLMDDDWEGHPLQKDYPLGGEPVRFSDAQ